MDLIMNLGLENREDRYLVESLRTSLEPTPPAFVAVGKVIAEDNSGQLSFVRSALK
jgi:hypothetical protein